MTQETEFDLATRRFVTAVADHFAGCALRAEWRDLDTVLELLNALSEKSMLHAHFPTGGGSDLCGAKRSKESGCLELVVPGESLHIVRPRSLQLERFLGDETGAWTYFRLVLDPLEPSGTYPEVKGAQEFLCQLESGAYLEADAIENPERPRSLRKVSRWLRGDFLLLAKGSTYNLMPATYDGSHSLGSTQEVTSEQFRDVIQEVVLWSTSVQAEPKASRETLKRGVRGL